MTAEPAFVSPLGATIISDEPHHSIQTLTQKNRDVWILPLSGEPPYRLNLPPQITTIGNTLLWSEDGTKLMVHVGDYTEGGLAGLYWFDIQRNQQEHVLTEGTAHLLNPAADAFAFPFSMNTDLSRVGFYNSRGEWYFYDVNGGQIEHMAWLDLYQQEPEFLILNAAMFSRNIPACWK